VRIGKLPGRLIEHFFSTGRTEPLALFRILFGSFLTLMFMISAPNWQRYYGEWATIPLSMIKGTAESRFSIFSAASSPGELWAIYALALLACLTFTLGFWTRTSTVVLFVIYSSMIRRNVWIVNGQDQIAHMFLFLSMFAPLGVSHSIDAFYKRRKEPDERGEAGPSLWCWRLMKLSFVLIYLWCGPTKFESWKDGLAIYHISLAPDWFRFPRMEWFHEPLLSVVCTYATLFLECSFPFLIWIERYRGYALASMALLHLGLMIVMAPSVFYFNLAMLIGLSMFAKGDWLGKLR